MTSLNKKQVAVLGLGVSNLPLLNYLSRHGAIITVCDRKTKEELGENYNYAFALGAQFSLGNDYLHILEEKDFDYVFRTPGIRPDRPEIKAAELRGARITSEISQVLELAPCPVVGITGSDGKTTTTTMTARMLEAAGKTVHLGGNIGTPLIDEVENYQASDIIVLELSSFQLMDMEKSPEYALVTNLSPNHLDYHKDYDEYVNAKKHVFSHQNKTGLLVLNADNPDSLPLLAEARGKVEFFSRKNSDTDARLIGEDLFLGEEKICSRSEMKLLGDHNIENTLAASLLARAAGAYIGAIRTVAISFSGVEHRLEMVRELDGVKYYNDSIASSPTRAIAGINSFKEDIILIAGGSDKYISFAELGEVIARRVKALILMGQTADKIESAVRDAGISSSWPLYRVGNMTEAVSKAREVAESGDVVLLSPACASFDMYKNFAERGDIFRSTVLELVN